MPKQLNIFATPGQVTLYDATNGYMYLGYCDDITIKERSKFHKTIESLERHYYYEYELYGTFPYTGQELINTLYSRRNIRQTIYIVGYEGYLKVEDVYIDIDLERNWGNNRPHRFRLYSSWSGVDRAKWRVNILNNGSIDYRFESFRTEGMYTGIAIGWIATNYVIAYEVNSFLNNEGQAQKIVYSGSGSGSQQYYNSFVILPIGMPTRVTASLYIRNNNPGFGHRYRIIIGFRHTDNTYVFYHETSYRTIPDTPQRISYSATCKPLAGKLIRDIYMVLDIPNTDSADILLDNAQIELGKLSNFRDD